MSRHYEDLFSSESESIDYNVHENATDTGAIDQIDSLPLSETGIDYDLLSQFLSSPLYKHYRPFLKLAPNKQRSSIPVVKFWFQITFHNTTNWKERIGISICILYSVKPFNFCRFDAAMENCCSKLFRFERNYLLIKCSIWSP